MLWSICALRKQKNWLIASFNVCVNLQKWCVRHCSHQNKRRTSLFFFQQSPRLAKGNRQQSLLLWTHQLFGSAGHLVSAEQMRLEADSGVWLLSNYTVSEQLHSALLFWKFRVSHKWSIYHYSCLITQKWQCFLIPAS